MSSATGGNAQRRVEGEASPSVSPSMEGVLPIRGVDGNTDEALPIGPAPGLREASDPYRVEVVRWAILDVPSIMVEEDLTRLREEYRIPSDIDLILPGPNERACFPMRGCTALHLNAFVSGMRLPLHPMLRRILRAYDLAPTQVAPNGWSQMVGGHVLVVSALVWHGDAFARVPNSVPAEEVAEEERQRGGDRLRVIDDPELDLDVPSVYGIASSLPCCELSRESIDVIRSIYQADSKSRSYGFILNRQRCLVELGLVASAAEMDQGRRPRPTLAKLVKQRPRTLVPGSAEDTSQRKAIEDLSRAGNKEAAEASKVIEVDDAPEAEVPLSRKRKAKSSGVGPSQATAEAMENAGLSTTCNVSPLQRTLAVNTSGEVVLEGPSKSTPASEGGSGGPYDSKRRLRELIGAPGVRIPDDVLRNLPFSPSMGAQAVKKYFTPNWEEFSSHGELEDVLEASLASMIRASSLQIKVLGEFRTRMQEQRKLVAQASKADKEHQQAMEGLKAALETEALEAANKEKRRLLEEAKSREEEISSLRKELANSEKGKKEAEDGKKEVEARLANAEADFVANFHNTEAYTNFADYFARVGQQEVLNALRNDHPEFDVKNLEVRFPPPNAEGEEDS
ncbi:Uncharacterized protein Adt_14911 [Abeliophyllum distichum]|uniref:Transposase (putative) gypsy type domain-containing protein n=1 Tax=Abeliophyllum distichum TaxID=126358 RepID=A0ABD1U0Z3_9LAMI